MTTIEKLNFQRQLGGLILFREGVFLRAYNESCYLLDQVFNQQLKIHRKQIKSANNRWFMMSGFPESKLHDRLPLAQLTSFGAKLVIDFEFKDYQNWFDLNWRHANNISEASIIRATGA